MINIKSTFLSFLKKSYKGLTFVHLCDTEYFGNVKLTRSLRAMVAIQNVILQQILMTDILSISTEIALIWIP